MRKRAYIEGSQTSRISIQSRVEMVHKSLRNFHGNFGNYAALAINERKLPLSMQMVNECLTFEAIPNLTKNTRISRGNMETRILSLRV